MHPRDTPLEATPEGALPSPVTGTLVEGGDFAEGALASVQPSAADQNNAADRARGRTTMQVGLPSAVLAVIVWQLRRMGIDLNPSPDETELPTEVAAAWLTLLTVAFAFRMNPKTKTQG
jgi:hypothetical protein